MIRFVHRRHARCRVIARCVSLLSMFTMIAPAALCALEPTRAELDAFLANREANYSRTHQMLGMPFESPGYHSKVPQGTWVHPTRRSMQYAVLLVVRGQPQDVSRAEQIIRKVLSLQVTDPAHKYYGVWPWLLEEPIDQMDPPDRNWADFLGAQIAVLVRHYSDRLNPELNTSLRTSLRHAALEIRQRDVQPSYTNIAIMGGGVCAAAGELLGDSTLLRYGRQRLQRCVEHAETHGSFNEYNSPTYTCVALFESERVLDLIDDVACRQAAETLRQMAWKIVADSYHPATGQWAGPQSRTYADYLSADTAAFLTAQTGVSIPVAPLAEPSTNSIEPFPHLPCPEPLQRRFEQLPADPTALTRTFIRQADGQPDTIGTTWLSSRACLGSVNHSMLWTQRRPLLGYWSLGGGQVACLRLRFLHDQQDFASMGVRNAQRGPRVLTLFEPLANRGSWHPSLDRPADGLFTASDFRVHFELTAPGASAQKINDHCFALIAGRQRAVIHVLPSRFEGQEVQWSCTQQEGVASVAGVCYSGTARQFAFAELQDVRIAVAVEIVDQESAPLAAPTWNGADSPPSATWNLGAEILCVGD